MAAEPNAPPIQSRTDLIEAMARGAKPRQDWRIGTEHEKHLFHTEGALRPVAYGGANGIRALLEAMQRETGWTFFYDDDNPIGMRNDTATGGISLEPGGQFELSGAQQPDMHASFAETAEHMALCRKIGAELGIGFLGLGMTPLWSVADIPAVPKSRYRIMAPYMGKTGTLGTSMMFRTATVQTNLDFASEADMVRKLRVSLALQPIVTALFANSPFVDGRDSGYLSYRAHIWQHTDDDRTGILPFVFEEGFGFERYADYALDVPMYFVVREGRYVNLAGASFRDFLDGKLDQLPGETPTVRDWEDHLSTAFPEVRLKQFLEMRGADMGDEASVSALSALWTGLLYDETALETAYELVSEWGAEERRILHEQVPRTGLETPWPGDVLRFGVVNDAAREVVGIASAGLARRAVLNGKGEDESIYLAPLERTIRDDRAPAQRWLEKYRGEWGGDLTRIFEEAAL